MSVVGRLWLPSLTTDNLFLKESSDLSLPSSSTEWKIQYDSAGQELKFAETGNAQTIKLMTSGGYLHGQWSTESIISASDRRLKRSVVPLYETLLGTRRQLAGGSAEVARDAASNILQHLQPNVLSMTDEAASTTAPKYALSTEDVKRALPDLVRTTGTGGEGINYQDLIAVIALATKERQEKLNAHEEAEAAELRVIERQDALLHLMETQLSELKTRLTRLMGKHPKPPSLM